MVNFISSRRSFHFYHKTSQSFFSDIGRTTRSILRDFEIEIRHEFFLSFQFESEIQDIFHINQLSVVGICSIITQSSGCAIVRVLILVTKLSFFTSSILLFFFFSLCLYLNLNFILCFLLLFISLLIFFYLFSIFFLCFFYSLFKNCFSFAFFFFLVSLD